MSLIAKNRWGNDAEARNGLVGARQPGFGFNRRNVARRELNPQL
jgi:hypothetical protein